MHTAKTKYLTSLILELSTYLGRHPSPSPLLSPDILADVDVVDLKLSIISSPVKIGPITFIWANFLYVFLKIVDYAANYYNYIPVM
jgi:hypothetical protein